MANFSDNAITDLGRNLLGDVQMGAVFTPTRLTLGSGYLPSSTTTRTIKDVVSKVKDLKINKKLKANDGTVTIGGVYNNEDILEDFYFREFGLYAKAVYPDGRETAEVLYSYGNAGATADLMPAYSSGQPVERQMDLVTYIGNDTAIDLTIASGIYATKEDLEGIGGGVVIIPKGEDIPVSKRKEGYLYFREKTGFALKIAPNIKVEIVT